MDPNFDAFVAGELQQIRDQGLWKEEWPILGHQGPEIRVEGRDRPVLNFCANNYLGLSGDPRAARRRPPDARRVGLRHVQRALHLRHAGACTCELEKQVAEFLGMDDAILYAVLLRRQRRRVRDRCSAPRTPSSPTA